MLLKTLVHYGIHLLLPVLVGYLFYRGKRAYAILILLGGILIDLDHLLASPVFDPLRCSIGFHPLHSHWAITAYLLLLVFNRTRIYGLALLIHILADLTDCLYPIT
jgi:hypothetical protein